MSQDANRGHGQYTNCQYTNYRSRARRPHGAAVFRLLSCPLRAMRVEHKNMKTRDSKVVTLMP